MKDNASDSAADIPTAAPLATRLHRAMDFAEYAEGTFIGEMKVPFS